MKYWLFDHPFLGTLKASELNNPASLWAGAACICCYFTGQAPGPEHFTQLPQSHPLAGTKYLASSFCAMVNTMLHYTSHAGSIKGLSPKPPRNPHTAEQALLLKLQFSSQSPRELAFRSARLHFNKLPIYGYISCHRVGVQRVCAWGVTS